MRLSQRRFLELSKQALAEIPQPFRGLLHDLEISVKDAPGPEAGRSNGSLDLLGLYEGLSRSEMRTTDASAYLPARIFLYQRNIEARSPDAASLVETIRLTLRHELAHHFGFSDQDLREKWPEGA